MATITYTVTVASGTNQYGTGNKFYINGEVSPVLYLQEGNTYIFDHSDSTVSDTSLFSFFYKRIIHQLQLTQLVLQQHDLQEPLEAKYNNCCCTC